jgi:hypothetical protein
MCSLNKEIETIVLIQENIFLGNKKAAENSEFLRSFAITHILCVGKELEPNKVTLNNFYRILFFTN